MSRGHSDAERRRQTCRWRFSQMRIAKWIALFVAVPAVSAGGCPHYGRLECAGRGACVAFGNASTAVACACEDGRAGADCAIVLACDPQRTRMMCSGHGACADGHCECAPGYAGETCEEDVLCPRDPTGVVCSGEVCSNHACICRPQRSGVACEKLVSSSRILPESASARAYRASL